MSDESELDQNGACGISAIETVTRNGRKYTFAYQRWSEKEEIRLEELRTDGMILQEIAEHPDFKGRRTKAAIKRKLQEMGIARPKQNEAQALELFKEGFTRTEIATKLNLKPNSVRAISYRLRKEGFEFDDVSQYHKLIFKDCLKLLAPYKTFKDAVKGLRVHRTSVSNMIRWWRENVDPTYNPYPSLHHPLIKGLKCQTCSTAPSAKTDSMKIESLTKIETSVLPVERRNTAESMK